MRISNEVAAQLKGNIKAQLKDEYKIVCYPKGDCDCTQIDWHICESSGCPKAGKEKC